MTHANHDPPAAAITKSSQTDFDVICAGRPIDAPSTLGPAAAIEGDKHTL
jgi:hypothetical protein